MWQAATYGVAAQVNVVKPKLRADLFRRQTFRVIERDDGRIRQQLAQLTIEMSTNQIQNHKVKVFLLNNSHLEVCSDDR